MAQWIEQFWTPGDGPGRSRRARAGGTYHAYVPAPLVERHIHIPSDLARKASSVEQQILAISMGNEGDSGTGLEGIARFLLRSEAISSSRIEGIAPQPDKVAIAELTRLDPDAPGKKLAQLVANNVRVLQEMSHQLRTAGEITAQDISAAQYLLLGNPAISGFRTTQNWIGGTIHSPLEAEFVPPPPRHVPALMDDLVDYLNGATHGSLIQAALVHAQFETIHPFPDGNGRVGRALIHAVLQRRGLVRSPILPVSMVLGTWSDRYVHGLTRFRDDQPESTGVLDWLEIFFEATGEATLQATRLAEELRGLQQEWQNRVSHYRQVSGKRRALRADSIEYRILRQLPGHPLLTIKVATEIFGGTTTSAAQALDNLTAAGVLTRKSIDRGVTGYLAHDVFDVITIAERRLASTRFDTSVAPPTGRAVPVAPPTRTPTKDT